MPPKVKVTAYPLRDVKFSAALVRAQRQANWTMDRIQQVEPFRTHFISFVSVIYDPKTGTVICGLTSFANQVLYRFDPQTKTYEDLHFEKYDFSDRFDLKIHQSFEMEDSGTILAATAHLHDFGLHPEMPGGKLFRIDPVTGKCEFIGIPVPHTGIQTIALDRKRGIVYGNCHPVIECFAYDICKKQRLPFKWGFRNHHARCDHDGNYWGISEGHKERILGVDDEQAQILEEVFKRPSEDGKLFRYNPDDGYQVLDMGLPLFGGEKQSIADMIDGDDGYLYIGTQHGALYRLGKLSGKLDYLGVPNVGGRLEGLAFGADGLLYLAGGTFYLTRLSVYDRQSGKFTDLGPVYDPERDERCIIVHDMTITPDGTLYIGETDNQERSGYLWECQVKL